MRGDVHRNEQIDARTDKLDREHISGCCMANNKDEWDVEYFNGKPFYCA